MMKNSKSSFSIVDWSENTNFDKILCEFNQGSSVFSSKIIRQAERCFHPNSGERKASKQNEIRSQQKHLSTH